MAGAFAMLLLVAGCGNNDDQPSAETGSAADSSTLRTDLAKYFDGTDRPLPTEGPKAVAGKKVWVLSCSSAAPGCSVPAQAAIDAGNALGWQMTLVDGKFDPNTQVNQVRAAAAAHADGLITVAVDCPTIAGALHSAVDAGMKVMSVYGYDCNNNYTKADPLFSAEMNFGPYKNYEGLIGSDYSRAIAADVCRDGAHADVIQFREDDLLVARTVSDSFEKNVAGCGATIRTVTFTGQDLVTGTLQQKASAALSRFPTANVVMAPYDATILLGIGAAVDQARAGGRNLALTGGEGLPPNIGLIKNGSQQFAAGVPTDWAGWAMADALNRVFAGQPQVDEGIGIKSIDKDHEAGCRPYVGGNCVDFRGAYKKIWGVG